MLGLQHFEIVRLLLIKSLIYMSYSVSEKKNHFQQYWILASEMPRELFGKMRVMWLDSFPSRLPTAKEISDSIYICCRLQQFSRNFLASTF